MVGDTALVELTLKVLACSQKELAAKLQVSSAQISKWKKGEHMSRDMREKLRSFVDIEEMDPEFVLWAGSIPDAIKWRRLVQHLASVAIDSAETGYSTYLLEEEGIDSLCWQTFLTLKELGVDIPQPFPAELDFDYDTAEAEWEVLYENPYSALIREIYSALNDVYGFYAAYISELINDDRLELMDTDACNIESCLIELAATKIPEIPPIVTNFGPYERKVKRQFEDWLAIVKECAFRVGVPLRAELMDLVYDSADELSHSAEAESLGIDTSRIHPDIYMNELLVGMRIIHQVLPAIMKKLNIEDDFQLDTKDLAVHRNR